MACPTRPAMNYPPMSTAVLKFERGGELYNYTLDLGLSPERKPSNDVTLFGLKQRLYRWRAK